MDFKFEDVENGKIITANNGAVKKRFVYAEGDSGGSLTVLLADIITKMEGKVSKPKRKNKAKSLAAKKAWASRKKKEKAHPKEKAA